jgi:hypothetical protein
LVYFIDRKNGLVSIQRCKRTAIKLGNILIDLQEQNPQKPIP